MLARLRQSFRLTSLRAPGAQRWIHDARIHKGADTAAPEQTRPDAGTPRSAIFGAYPTRRRLVRAAQRAAARPDRNEAWRRDPVAVMRNSPQRQCIVSLERLPTAYMLNLRGLLLDEEGDTPRRVVAAPDGLHHPRWAQRRAGPGAWVALRPDALERVVNGEGKRFLVQLTAGPPRLAARAAEQVAAGLEERLYEELELVRLRVSNACARAGYTAEDAVLRPLSPSEAEAAEAGVAPNDAVAVMDVRFGAADRLTSAERATPHVPLLARPDAPDAPNVPLFPLHALLGPSPRAAALVTDVLAAEDGYARRCGVEVKHHPAPSYVAVQAPRSPGGVPLVIALWRLALWHGQGWAEPQAARREVEVSEI